MTANEKQIGGNHYSSEIQHWDYVIANDLDYFQAQVTKYVTRWKKKNGIQDLEKAQHFLEKYIEVQKSKQHNQEKIPASGENPYRRKIVPVRPFGYSEEEEGVE